MQAELPTTPFGERVAEKAAEYQKAGYTRFEAITVAIAFLMEDELKVIRNAKDRTLRDEFAKAAMQALITLGEKNMAFVSQKAYEQADMMMRIGGHGEK